MSRSDRTARFTRGESTPARRRRTIADAIGFGLANAAMTGGLAAVALRLDEIAWSGRTVDVVALFVLAGAVSGPMTWILAAVWAGRRPPTARFAAFFALLPVAVAGSLWGVYLLWQLALVGFGGEPFPSRAWLIEMAYEAASSAYIVAVSALPLLLPAAVVPLLAAAAVFARRSHG